jgi:hypothetical protein
MQSKLKSIGIVELAHRLKSFGHTLSVAVCTSRADFGATGDGIPCRFSPFDRGVYRHDPTPLSR